MWPSPQWNRGGGGPNVLSLTSKTRREASRNEFVEKGRMPDRVKRFREINSKQDRPRARPGFVKPIRNRLTKVQNLI